MSEGAYGRTDTLAPVGIQPGTPAAHSAAQIILGRRTAIINALKKPLGIAKSNRRIAAWGEDTDWPGECDTVIHKIRQSIETQVANHLKEPAQITIEPNETGEYAKWYWCGPAEAAAEVAIPVPMIDPESGAQMADEMDQPAMAAMGIDPAYLGGINPTTGETIPPVPLPTDLVKTLQAMAQAGEIEPNFICQLNDEYTAKTLQKQFDEEFRVAGGHRWLRSRVYAMTVEGWGLPLIEFDHERQRFYLRDNSIESTYIAQDHEHIDDSAEAGIDLFLDLDEAMALYPKQREAFIKLMGAISDGAVSSPNGGTVPTMFRDQYGRPMVPKIVWWMRNQPMLVPTSEEEAISAGFVQENFGLAQEQLQQIPTPPREGIASQPSEVGESPAGEDLEEAGIPRPSNVSEMGQGIDGHPQNYVLTATGLPVDPTSPEWPQKTTYILRQCTIVGEELVEDGECEWPDIPLLHLRNSLIIGRPWSVGEPFYTKKLQETITTIFTSASDHIKYNAHPALTMPAGLKNEMEAQFGVAFVSHGDILGLPPPYDQWREPVVKMIETPSFPESSFRILEMSVEQFNQISGRPDVLAGNSPTKNASGALAATLQQGAVEPLNFKAQDIAFALEKLANLFVFGILKFKKPQAISDATSVPLPLLMLLIERALKRPPQFKITISTGAGAVIHQKRAMFIQYNQTVDPATKMPLASGRTTKEILGLDPDTEDRRNEQAIKTTATVMAQYQPQEEDQASESSDKPQSANGNGHGGRFGGK